MQSAKGKKYEEEDDKENEKLEKAVEYRRDKIERVF